MITAKVFYHASGHYLAQFLLRAHFIIKFTLRTADLTLMNSGWFVQQNETVLGPLSTEDVQSRLQSGQVDMASLIWGPGMDVWKPISWWMNNAPRIGQVPAEESLVKDETWHLAFRGKSQGPFTKAVLLKELAEIKDIAEVLLWTKGMKEWAPIFEFHEVLTKLGVNKRQFPRADLKGKVVLKGDGLTLMAPIFGISEGGFGVNLDDGFTPGQILGVEIHSPVFSAPIFAKAEVRFVADGVMGFRFQQINDENKALIIQFVKQSQTRFILKSA